MAKRKHTDARPDVRATLAEQWRELAERYYGPLGVPEGDDPAGWLRRADMIDSGEAITLHGWQVAQLIPEVSAYDEAVTLEADGSFTVDRRGLRPGRGA